MPAKNPKHNRLPTAKSSPYVREYKKQRINKRVIITIAVLGVVVLGSIGLTTWILGTNQFGIARAEVGDTVSLTYWLWTSNSEQQRVPSEVKQTGSFDITLGDSEKTSSPSVIYGFYQMVLGMYNGTFDEEWMPGCIDDGSFPGSIAGDGWDDRYDIGEVRCLTYGSGELINTPLIYKIQINNIVKGT